MADIIREQGQHLPESMKSAWRERANGTHALERAVQFPTAIEGDGSPTVDGLYSVAVDLAANTANQVLVAAPGDNKQIWVHGMILLADTDAGTVTLQDDADNSITGPLALSDEGGYVLPMSGNFAMPWFKVAANRALEADTVTCSAGGLLSYAIVSV